MYPIFHSKIELVHEKNDAQPNYLQHINYSQVVQQEKLVLPIYS